MAAHILLLEGRIGIERVMRSYEERLIGEAFLIDDCKYSTVIFESEGNF